MTSNIAVETEQENDDLLWQHLKTLPAFRGLLRAVEARFYQQLEFPGPVLDIGCGDGNYTELTFPNRKIDVGIDPWWGPLNKARRSEKYDLVLQNAGSQWPFPDHTFQTAYSNSVLEHIPEIQAVLNEAGRVVKPNGRFVMTMPSHLFTEYLGGAGFFEKLGLNGAANRYRDFFNFISRHAHTDSVEVWAERLAKAGFQIERWQYYYSKEALRALEWGHVQGLPSAILHFLTGHWIIAPWQDNLRYTERWLRPFYEETFPEQGAYIFIIARKVADGPIEMVLPEQRPFTVEEFSQAQEAESEEPELVPAALITTPVIQESEQVTVNSEQLSVLSQAELLSDELSPIDQSTNRPIDQSTSPPTTPSPVISGGLIALILLFAMLGQSSILATPGEPTSGIRWFLFSGLALLTLLWYRQPPEAGEGGFSFQWPSIGSLARQRWYALGGIVLAFVAQRLGGTTTGTQRPFLAILIWLLAIALTFYALHKPSDLRFTIYDLRTPLLTAALLFLIALVVRGIALTSHPFILNGTETSIGLDALNVTQGFLRNPFGTAWLTNPTLPAFMMSIPIRLFGSSAFSLRLLSPLVGAATVAATYLIGQRLWNRTVGLVAAVLLLGSHFHLHYSRLGMTNIWDPFVTLLAVGLIGIAWEKAERKRLAWLLAGMAVGFNAYFFTSSRLLPIMLLVAFGLALFMDRDKLSENGRHLIAALLVALVVALPQILFYNGNPGIFMERANVLGILDAHSGWLSREAAQTGQTTTAVFQQQLWKGLLSFTASLDNSPSYRPQVPLLGFVSSMLLVVGLITAVFNLREFRTRLLVIWLTITLVFAAVLLENPPNSHRLVIATPAIALITAVGLSYLSSLFSANSEQSAGSGQQPPATNNQYTNTPITKFLTPLNILLLIAALLSIRDLAFYFGSYRAMTPPTFGDRNTEIAHEMGEYLDNLEGEWTAYFYGPPSMYVSFPSIPFLADEFRVNENLFDVETGAELQPAPTASRIFIFLPERAGEVSSVQTQFPNGELSFIPGAYADPLFTVYEVP
ncbi:MAG: glycosyltransferase family 39 protein [Chloroflexota bacterium]